LAPLGAKTLASYAAAAGAWLEFYFGKKAQLYLPSSLSGKHRLHPFLAETIAQCRNWQVPRKKKEPFTSPMFLVLHHDVSSLARDPSRLLDLLPAIYDWTRLGIFTGSRLGEYGQSKLCFGELFATVPMCPDAGEWAGTPLAFICEDFSSFLMNNVILFYGLTYLACSATLQRCTSASGTTRVLPTSRYVNFDVFVPHSFAPFPAAFPSWNELHIFVSPMDSPLAPIGLPRPVISNSFVETMCVV
jgi:hypothetical protein